MKITYQDIERAKQTTRRDLAIVVMNIMRDTGQDELYGVKRGELEAIIIH